MTRAFGDASPKHSEAQVVAHSVHLFDIRKNRMQYSTGVKSDA
jgi:hypothetical protein